MVLFLEMNTSIFGNYTWNLKQYISVLFLFSRTAAS